MVQEGGGGAGSQQLIDFGGGAEGGSGGWEGGERRAAGDIPAVSSPAHTSLHLLLFLFGFLSLPLKQFDSEGGFPYSCPFILSRSPSHIQIHWVEHCMHYICESIYMQ